MKALEALREARKNPQAVAREAKAAGKKVLGYRCLFVPEEIIDAAGALPYPIFGTAEAVSQADSYFQPNVCEFIRNVFDLALKGKLDFLDGVALCNTCDAVRKLYDHWKAYIKTPFCYMINNPQRQFTPGGMQYQLEELQQFRQALSSFTGQAITDAALEKSIRLHNETRSLLREVYEFRKPDPPMISGEEALDIVMGAMILPKARANGLLRQLIGELKQRQQSPVNPGPRIMITGSIIEQPGLIGMVEDSGGVVVSDDLCTATRYFWYKVGEEGDPMTALARHTTEKPVCSCMHPAEKRLDYMLELVREYNVQGIIYFNLMYCDPFLYESVLFKKKFEDKGIPTIALETEHTPSGMGQLKTRVQAFLEMM